MMTSRNTKLDQGNLGKPTRYSGRSTRHPYVMNDFQGTPEIQEIFRKINSPQTKTVTYINGKKC